MWWEEEEEGEAWAEGEEEVGEPGRLIEVCVGATTKRPRALHYTLTRTNAWACKLLRWQAKSTQINQFFLAIE